MRKEVAAVAGIVLTLAVCRNNTPSSRFNQESPPGNPTRMVRQEAAPSILKETRGYVHNTLQKSFNTENDPQFWTGLLGWLNKAHGGSKYEHIIPKDSVGRERGTTYDILWPDSNFQIARLSTPNVSVSIEMGPFYEAYIASAYFNEDATVNRWGAIGERSLPNMNTHSPEAPLEPGRMMWMAEQALRKDVGTIENDWYETDDGNIRREIRGHNGESIIDTGFPDGRIERRTIISTRIQR